MCMSMLLINTHILNAQDVVQSTPVMLMEINSRL